jgi:hypothetical protein
MILDSGTGGEVDRYLGVPALPWQQILNRLLIQIISVPVRQLDQIYLQKSISKAFITYAHITYRSIKGYKIPLQHIVTFMLFLIIYIHHITPDSFKADISIPEPAPLVHPQSKAIFWATAMFNLSEV